MSTIIELPSASIGGYGRVLDDLTTAEVFQRVITHTRNVDRLKAELAAEIAREAVAREAVARRMESEA